MADHAIDTDLLYRLWGKTNEREKGYVDSRWEYHPAVCHMIDVGYVAEVWLGVCPSIMDRFCMLAPGIDRDVLQRIIVTITALHDLGKVHRHFQAKSERGWDIGYGAQGAIRITDYSGFDHGLATARILSDFTNKQLPEWKSWKNAVEAVGAHHGRFYSNEDLDLSKKKFPSLSSVDRSTAVAAVALITELFELPVPLPPAPKSSAFNMLLAGFVSVSDWFGSNSEIFPFTSISEHSDVYAYLHQLRSGRSAENQLREAGLIGTYRKDSPTYQDIFPFLDDEEKLRPMQRLSRELSFGHCDGSEIVIVEAPMGMGKTEIALYLAAQAITHGHADGLYFALPTQASSNALFDRIYSFTDRIKHRDSAMSLAVAHGGKRYFHKYQELQHRTWQEAQERQEGVLRQFEKSRADRGAYRDTAAPPSEVIAPSWLQSSKRALLASVGIGTIDQAMLGAISVKHAFVRLFALAGKVVVFDEIHAYDSYMNVVIEHLLRWLHALGAKVVLLSATLPRGLRNRLLSTYQPPTARMPAQSVDDSVETNSESDPYPQMIHLTPANDLIILNPGRNESEAASRPTRIELHKVDNNDRNDHGAQLALNLAARGGCIAWIRNTVREAQETWRTLRARADEIESSIRPSIVLLHARFTRNDRSTIEQNLVEILGKDGGVARPHRMIVIATQVIEQSIDIDFDAMISDLAPVDLLLQRSGRLWRHDRKPEERYGHARPVLHVLAPDVNELHTMTFGSSVYVYEDEVLARSHWLLQHNTTLDMPAACRRLVARLYDYPDQEWSADHLGVDPERLDRSRQRRKRMLDTMTGTAKRILMPGPTVRSLVMHNAFSDDDRGDSVALTTRHGGASATAVLLDRRNGVLHCLGNDEPVPHPLPDTGNISGTLKLDEAVLLSSVSFPWYESLTRASPNDENVEALDSWWRDRHPFDNKTFLLLDPDDMFEHSQFRGRYLRDASGVAVEGLVIERKRDAMQTDTISYEDL